MGNARAERVGGNGAINFVKRTTFLFQMHSIKRRRERERGSTRAQDNCRWEVLIVTDRKMLPWTLNKSRRQRKGKSADVSSIAPFGATAGADGARSVKSVLMMVYIQASLGSVKYIFASLCPNRPFHIYRPLLGASQASVDFAGSIG